ncbi:MAG TPA: phosphatidate cytidylyltransferase [Acidimicrobiales bacterium]|nr:phosphatidate cytidylyltransferase [Acidimicrobiales bacterium]
MDDRDEYEQEAEAPGEPVTERVRIIGAQPAGEALGDDPRSRQAAPSDDPTDRVADPEVGRARSFDLFGDESETEIEIEIEIEADIDIDSPPAPARPEEAGWSAPSGRNGGDPLEPGADVLGRAEHGGVVPDMPHWTDPPTGQVPAVLDRRGDDDTTDAPWSAAGDTGPAWREHSHEWDDSGFDPSLLADDETRVGALEETPVEERRPWEFQDLHNAPADREPVAAPEAGGGAESWWDDEAQGASEPALPGRPAMTTAYPTEGDSAGPDTAERGVASISSSPLRAQRDLAGAAGVPRGPASRRTSLPPGGSGEGSGRNLPVAIATGVGIALLAVLCAEVGTVATLVLSTVVVTLAAAECYAALRRAGRRPATLLGLVATVAIMVSAYAKGLAALPLVLVLVVITSMVWHLVGVERGSTVEGVASTLLGFLWVGFLGSFAALMLAPGQYPHRHGIAFLLGAIVATIGADVGALAIGSWLGRHHMAPNVSPHKTWEGFIGGAVVAIALSAAVTGQVHPWTVPKAALLGLVVAVVAPIGDLCESLVKRDLGLKDMGSILPGHGGVLDRVDALLFVLPATFYLVRVLNLG